MSAGATRADADADGIDETGNLLMGNFDMPVDDGAFKPETGNLLGAVDACGADVETGSLLGGRRPVFIGIDDFDGIDDELVEVKVEEEEESMRGES